jgi:hypothetical protein
MLDSLVGDVGKPAPAHRCARVHSHERAYCASSQVARRCCLELDRCSVVELCLFVVAFMHQIDRCST